MKAPKGYIPSRGVRCIAFFKLGAALLLLAAGCEIFHVLDSDVSATLQRWIRLSHISPGRPSIDRMLASVSGVSPRTLRAIDAGTFFYGFLHLTEGIGLLKEKPWAEYLTIFATASLLPLECFELARGANPFKWLALLLNLVILFYLIRQVRRNGRKPS